MSFRHIRSRAKTIAFALAIAVPAAAPAAEQIDQAELMKWYSVVQVKYTIVGQFEASDVMIVDEFGGNADVKDRVEIELVLDQTTAKLVGQPKIKNFATEVSNVRDPVTTTCPPPILSSAYEHFTLEKFGDGENALGMTMSRIYAGADAAQSCTGGVRERIAAKRVEEQRQYLLPLSIQLAVPQQQQDKNVTVDKKTSTITVKSNDGWIWANTLSPVK